MPVRSGHYCDCETCEHDPRTMLGQPIGMYHCPSCDEMVLAGFPHPTHRFDCRFYDEPVTPEPGAGDE